VIAVSSWSALARSIAGPGGIGKDSARAGHCASRIRGLRGRCVLGGRGCSSTTTTRRRWLAGSVGRLAVHLRVTPELLWTGLKWALAIGFIGGLFPAVRAARLPVTTALREL